MIEIVNAYRRSGNEWCTCCQKQTNTKRIKFSQDGRQGVSVVLCDNCRKELSKALEEQEPQTGHWIENDTIRQCNMCRALYPKGQRCGAYHYCPNCGAKLESEEERYETCN